MQKNYLLFVILCFSFIVQLIYAQPKMNEIYSRGVPGNLDWIEIYNGTALSVDISGFKIYDNGGQAGTKPKKLFLPGTVIPANGFYVIITDTASFPGDSSAFGLSSGGEKVWFENASGVLLDSVTFPAMGTTQSYGRSPDGGTWQLLNTITRGYSNFPIGILDETTMIKDYALYQNYPNPFNPSTNITYAIPLGSYVTLKVFNILGKEIATLVNEYQNAGSYKVQFDGKYLSGGIYFYQITAGNFTQTRKLSLLK